jgi:hypothetical protein
MTEEITGYKFNNISQANGAANSLKAHYFMNRPPAPPEGYTTTEWVSVSHNNGASGDFYYFHGDFAPVLGNPSVFNIDISDDI